MVKKLTLFLLLMMLTLTVALADTQVQDDAGLFTADEIAEKTHSDVVQVIGTRFVLYRESRDNKQIRLVK